MLLPGRQAKGKGKGPFGKMPFGGFGGGMADGRC